MRPEMSGWQGLVLMAWVAMAAGVAILSLLPGTSPSVSDVPSAWTNAAHVPAYALLMAFTILMVARFMRVTALVLWSVVVLVSAFGVGMEFLQPLMGRTASLMDAGSNTVGACVAAAGYHIWAAGRLADRSAARRTGAPARRRDRV